MCGEAEVASTITCRKEVVDCSHRELRCQLGEVHETTAICHLREDVVLEQHVITV